MSSLGSRAARGAVVTVGAQFVRIVLQVGGIAILARLLAPEDYGLLAMAVAIVGVGEIVRDFGLSSAAIQAPSLSNAQRDVLFWINTGIGLALAGVVALSAGLIARTYGQEELVAITQALAVTFLLNGAATQYRASLNRAMRFAALAVVEIAAPVVALGVAVALAMSGAGYWALVGQSVGQAATALVVVVIMGRWLPRLPQRGVVVRPLLRFGRNLLGSQLLAYLGNNIDTFIVGYRFGPVQLGFYSRAFGLLMTPLTQLRAPSTTVALPVLSRVSDDEQRYARFIRTGQLVLGFPIAIGLAAVIGTARPVIDVFLGPGWGQVAPLMQLLAVAGIFQTLAYVGYWVYLSRGLTAKLFRYALVTISIRVVCLVVGSAWGVTGVAVGYAVAPMIAWPISLWWLSRLTSLPTRALYGGALRILATSAVACLASAVATSLLVGQASWAQVLGGAGGAGVAVMLVAVVAAPVRRDLAEVASVASRALRGRSVG